MQVLCPNCHRAKTLRESRELLQAKATRGHAVTSAPYGYVVKRVGEHAEYEKVEDEEPRVVKVFEVALQGFGNRKIAAKLNAENIPGPTGPWSKEQVRRVLANRLYKGELVYGKFRSMASGGKSNEREAVPEIKWVVTQVPHLRMVDDVLWDRVRAVRAQTTIKYGVPKMIAKGTEERKHI